jgi:hypothetical protein
LKTTFDKGPEGWCSYDYHGSVTGGKNIFILTTHERSGGVNDSGYVWCDEHRWSADTPEVPLSILPLLYYRSWTNDGPVDLRGAEVSVYLRGDNLNVYGADCLFWVHSNGTRWHFNSNPLEISDGRWADEPLRFTLKNDESLWHMSWTGRAEGPASLDTLLKGAVSYGFSFVNISDEVRGRLSMDELEIKLASE